LALSSFVWLRLCWAGAREQLPQSLESYFAR
jgi:hypothetical protein